MINRFLCGPTNRKATIRALRFVEMNIVHSRESARKATAAF